MRLAQILYTQGFGTRRECDGLIAAGFVRVHGAVCDDPDAEFATDGLSFDVRGERWPFHPRALVMLHKPAGYECSQKPKHHPSVLSLLPAPLRRRDIQPIGRLDADTTGLLLLTDDGPLIHRLNSPKRHVAKVYEARCKHPIDAALVEQLLGGVQLVDERETVRAAACRALDEHLLELTLTEGKYHQVKRMVAAAGNRVEALHRSRYGALELPADLAPGAWRWLDGPDAIVASVP